MPASPGGPSAAMEKEVKQLRQRVQQQQNLIKQLQETQALSSDDDDDAVDVIDDIIGSADAEQRDKPTAEQARQVLKAASDTLRRGVPHANALFKALKPLVAVSKLELTPTDDPTEARMLERDQAVGELRDFLMQVQRVVGGAQAALVKLVPPTISTSRAGYISCLGEIVGAPPDRTWKDEWFALNMEGYRQSGQKNLADRDLLIKSGSPELVMANFSPTIDSLEDHGWDRENGGKYCLLGSASNALSTALRERSDRYAACTYALSEVLWKQHEKKRDNPPPPLYWHRYGKQSLCEDDPAWAHIEEPDATGYCGLTCTALVLAERTVQSFTEKGFRARTMEEGKVNFEVMDSDVICFESAVDDALGAHSAVLTTTPRNGVFPPNCQFKLKAIIPPGEWRAPSASLQARVQTDEALQRDDGKTAPVYPKQRLLVVSCTYLAPHADPTGKISQQDAKTAPKMCSGAAAMLFGVTEAFIKGLDGLTERPVLTLASEFGRNMTWQDSDGVEHSLQEAFGYVTGPATLEERTIGHEKQKVVRDANNAGKLPDDFLKEANDFIRQRRDAGHFSLPEHSAFLTMEEVLAVRLYTGPAYQPINHFVRHVSTVVHEQRLEIVRHSQLTFSATVGHLCGAIRKLADVATEKEVVEPLWMGMRGGLPDSFWQSTAEYAQSGVTMAFTSASRDREVPISRMHRLGTNVLWELKPCAEDQYGFHRGANVEMLSQYAEECECLFPPGTMLSFKQDPTKAVSVSQGTAISSKSGKFAKEEKEEKVVGANVVPVPAETTEGNFRFTQLKALPTFL